MHSVGWMKDGIAAIAFVVTIVLYPLPHMVIVGALAMCATVDGLFFAFPSWHCLQPGMNTPTVVVVGATILALVTMCAIIWERTSHRTAPLHDCALSET